MRLVSTTLCGERDVGKVAEALQHAGWLVDAHILIWTGADDPPPDLVAASFASVRETTIRSWRWTGSFSDARNASLNFARENGADFSVMLDADERIVCPEPAKVRAFLDAQPPEITILTAHMVDGSFTRERFFRGDISQRWYLRTHESIDSTPNTRAVVPRDLLSWSEEPKTIGDVAAKCERDLALLNADLGDYPDAGATMGAHRRLLFYKGQTLEHMGRLQESIDCYRAVAKGNAGEGAAWACYCAARDYLKLDPPNLLESIHACIACIQREPRLAEPYWLAGCIYHDLGHFEWAIGMLRLAKTMAASEDICGDLGGFRDVRALGDGPDYVIDLCQKAIAARKGTPTRIAGVQDPAPAEPVAAEQARIEPVDTSKIHITVTSTALRAPEWAGRCIRSVRDQTWQRWRHHYVACDDATLCAGIKASHAEPRVTVHVRPDAPPLLANLIPIWRSLPPEEVIVWIDGDDWLATDHALAQVAEAHARGAWVTYGSFIYADGRPGFARQMAPHEDPHTGPWVTTHLKSFRAGLVQRVREADWRWPDGSFIDLAVDQAVMRPMLEMAGPERSVYIPEVLYVYNFASSFEANAGPEGKARERAALDRIVARQRYERVVSL